MRKVSEGRGGTATHQLHPILVNVCVEVNLSGCLASAGGRITLTAPGGAEAGHLLTDF